MVTVVAAAVMDAVAGVYMMREALLVAVTALAAARRRQPSAGILAITTGLTEKIAVL